MPPYGGGGGVTSMGKRAHECVRQFTTLVVLFFRLRTVSVSRNASVSYREQAFMNNLFAFIDDSNWNFVKGVAQSPLPPLPLYREMILK